MKNQYKPEDPNKVIERQQEPQNPLIKIMQGMVLMLEGSINVMGSLNVAHEEDAEKLREWSEEVSAYITELELTRLFQTMVVKVQRPLASNSPSPGCLVYNETKSFGPMEVTMDENLLRMFDDGSVKKYVRARLWVDGVLHLMDEVEDQNPGW